MSEPLRAMADDELGDAVSSLDLAWPATPDLVPAVMGRVAASPATIVRLPRRRRTKILLIAAAVTLLLAGAAVAAKLVIDLGAVVVSVPEESRTLPKASPPPLGEPIGLDEAADLLGSAVPIPEALGAPDRVWADRVVTDVGFVVRVTLAWDAGPALPAIDGSRFGAVLMRFEGDLDLASKEVYEDTGTVRPSWVGSNEAIWTTGPHLLRLLTGDGVASVRVDGNVLLWRDGAHTLRLETTLPEVRAVRIAESIPGTS
jgi:hypothetical protein